ncbi:MAG TPA: hypothetical protein PK289_02675 [Bacteroidia bacterium]|jgi:hypothetical protein|nr:hypothetical protein [Bacteroidia bacterium]HRG52971.1 hypothetical protein [Bacteroidia bacterium]
MRIIANIPHPKLTISIFSMNDKYQVKFEAGPMEQTYKLSHSEIDGVEGIKKMVDDAFLEQILNRFNEMFLAYKAAKERLNA